MSNNPQKGVNFIKMHHLDMELKYEISLFVRLLYENNQHISDQNINA